MKHDDPEFKETLKNIFDHPIVCRNHSTKESFLGYKQGGVNAYQIVGIYLISQTGTEEKWVVEWDHPNKQLRFGSVTIRLTEDDKCYGELDAIEFAHQLKQAGINPHIPTIGFLLSDENIFRKHITLSSEGIAEK